MSSKFNSLIPYILVPLSFTIYYIFVFILTSMYGFYGIFKIFGSLGGMFIYDGIMNIYDIIEFIFIFEIILWYHSKSLRYFISIMTILIWILIDIYVTQQYNINFHIPVTGGTYGQSGSTYTFMGIVFGFLLIDMFYFLIRRNSLFIINFMFLFIGYQYLFINYNYFFNVGPLFAYQVHEAGFYYGSISGFLMGITMIFISFVSGYNSNYIGGI